jgi:ABC-2 type transport system ATP-binding protein
MPISSLLTDSVLYKKDFQKFEVERMTTPVLAVHGLSKRVRNRTIVKDVSFSVFPGQVFGFLGPNGAGKTTTIRMLVGLIRPSAGEVRIGGYDIQSHALEAMRQVGCIVENPDLYPYLTGRENLLQLARMQGESAVHRVDEVAELVHLRDRLDEKVRTYSLGMRQRLGIAQALLGNPRLLILDEPTNGLDPAGIRELRTFLQDLAKTGLAVFISSHLLSEVELLCSHVAIIREGTVIQTGAIESLLSGASGDVIWRVEPVAPAKEVLRTVLSTFGDSANAQVIESETGLLSCPMSDEMIAEAAAMLPQQGCKIFEVTRRRISLEDFFLQTTK